MTRSQISLFFFLKFNFFLLSIFKFDSLYLSFLIYFDMNFTPDHKFHKFQYFKKNIIKYIIIYYYLNILKVFQSLFISFYFLTF